MKTISRAALYRRVWTEPKRHIAGSFGVTSDRLSRLCRRNQIPIPVQGFWNRGPEDRAALKSPLPHPEQDWVIEIEPSAGHVPDDGSVVNASGIQIPDKVTGGHMLIRQTRPLLEECRQDEHGRFRPGTGCLDILVTKACRQRAYRVMQAILKECEAREWTVRVTESRWPKTIVTVEGAEIAISLEEMLAREARKFTEEERRGHHYGMQLYPRFPSGRFVLKTDWPSENGRRAWREGKRFPLEHVLKQFLDGLETAGIWRRNADGRAAKAAEERRKTEQERWEREKAARREAELVERLLANAESWAKSRTLRDYIQARVDDWKAKGVDVSDGSDAARWVAWATMQADRLDPLVKTAPSVLEKPRPQSFWDIMSALGTK